MSNNLSVLLRLKEELDSLPIKNTNITRINLTLQQAVDMVLWALEKLWGGEIFVAKFPVVESWLLQSD